MSTLHTPLALMCLLFTLLLWLCFVLYAVLRMYALVFFSCSPRSCPVIPCSKQHIRAVSMPHYSSSIHRLPRLQLHSRFGTNLFRPIFEKITVRIVRPYSTRLFPPPLPPRLTLPGPSIPPPRTPRRAFSRRFFFIFVSEFVLLTYPSIREREHR